jgi:predicted 3-demethylubiquinone-9 3-methyltransferase (glyoxalase superfamily)/uncharacterized protein YndB with AHSA1/START domain
MTHKIYPCLWFDGQANAAASFYCSIFKDSKITSDTPMVVNFELNGQRFMGLNGGPQFKVNPAVSYFVYCGNEEEIVRLYDALSDGGSVLMPLGEYDWSTKYAWVADKFGVNWQLDIDEINSAQKIVPSLLFANEKMGFVKSAVQHYTRIFEPSRMLMEMPYPDQANVPEGTLLFAQFKVLDYIFNSMDSTIPHDFDFSEGNSFVVDCDNQEEVDYYWEKLTADGGQESQCAWLKDKFGVSWQIVPRQLIELLNDPDRAKANRVMHAMLQMKKIDIHKLNQAATMNDVSLITVEATINAPIEKVWASWTEPQHITQWNHASDDWHCPKASNDLQVGGTLLATMAAKDGSFGFDFEGIYKVVEPLQRLEYALGDGRVVKVVFSQTGDQTHVVEEFEAETIHLVDMQQAGWQAILNNFKKHTETL